MGQEPLLYNEKMNSCMHGYSYQQLSNPECQMSNMLEMLKPQPQLCRKVHRRDSLARVCETAGRYNKKKCPEKGSMHRKYGQEENRENIIVQRNGMKPQRVEDE